MEQRSAAVVACYLVVSFVLLNHSCEISLLKFDGGILRRLENMGIGNKETMWVILYNDYSLMQVLFAFPRGKKLGILFRVPFFAGNESLKRYSNTHIHECHLCLILLTKSQF